MQKFARHDGSHAATSLEVYMYHHIFSTDTPLHVQVSQALK